MCVCGVSMSVCVVCVWCEYECVRECVWCEYECVCVCVCVCVCGVSMSVV